jgi:ferredoxin-nitrate reductase
MARFPAKITKAIAPGTVFVPMHWGALWADNAEANALTHPEACPSSLQPELKACAVQVLPLPIAPSVTDDLLQSSQSSMLTASPSV